MPFLLQTCRCAWAGVRVGCSVPQRGDHNDSHARCSCSLHPTGSVLDGQALSGVNIQAVGCSPEAVGCRLAIGHLAQGSHICVSHGYWQAVGPTRTLKVLVCRRHPAAAWRASAQQAARRWGSRGCHGGIGSQQCLTSFWLLDSNMPVGHARLIDHNSDCKEAAQLAIGQAAVVSILTAHFIWCSPHPRSSQQ